MTHAATKRMLLAGAQHRLAVVLQDGALPETAGATLSTHILKPEHPDADHADFVISEWLVMRLVKPQGHLAHRCPGGGPADRRVLADRAGEGAHSCAQVST